MFHYQAVANKNPVNQESKLIVQEIQNVHALQLVSLQKVHHPIQVRLVVLRGFNLKHARVNVQKHRQVNIVLMNVHQISVNVARKEKLTMAKKHHTMIALIVSAVVLMNMRQIHA